MTETNDNSEYKNFCLCGCGQVTNIFKDKYRKYIKGHHKKQITGSLHPNWKGGRVKQDNYWWVRIQEHPFMDSRGYIREHRLVYEQHYNCILLPYVDIHHIDGNTENNAIENLKPMYRNQHQKLEAKKDMSDRYCYLCGKKTTISKDGYERWYLYKNKYICRICYARLKRKE